MPSKYPGEKHVYHQFVVRHQKRDYIMSSLEKKDIKTLIHYPIPAHLQPAFMNISPKSLVLANTERIAKNILSLPIYPELTDSHINEVCESLKVSLS